MKIIVTGSLGNISKPLTQQLVSKGHEVTIISRKADLQKEIMALGAKAAIGSLEDTAFLKETFVGADAVYAMTPPNFAAMDLIGYYQEIAISYAVAAKSAGVKHIVYLSSYGADHEKNTGIIVGSHQAEGILNEQAGTIVTCLRPGYFYYNLYSFLNMIRDKDMIGTNFGGEDKLVMVSPFDIADAAAEELINFNPQSKVRYIASDERTCSDVARLIGEAIGKPDLQWLIFSDEQVRKIMLENGRPPVITDLLIQVGAAIHSGLLRSDYEKHKPEPGKVKLLDFVKEFAAAYHKIQ